MIDAQSLLKWALKFLYDQQVDSAPQTLVVEQDDLTAISQYFYDIIGDQAVAKLSKVAGYIDPSSLLWSLRPGNPQPVPPLAIIQSTNGSIGLVGGLIVLHPRELPDPKQFRNLLKVALAGNTPSTLADAVLAGEMVPYNLRAFLANHGSILVLVGHQAQTLKRLFVPVATAYYECLTSIGGNARTGLLSMAFNKNAETAKFVRRQLTEHPFILIKHARFWQLTDLMNAHALKKLVKLLHLQTSIVVQLPQEDVQASEHRTQDHGMYWVTPNQFAVQTAPVTVEASHRPVSAADQAVAKAAAWLKSPMHHFEYQAALAHTHELQRRSAVGVCLPDDPWSVGRV
jgi:hypothetical protein